MMDSGKAWEEDHYDKRIVIVMEGVKKRER